MTNVRKTVRQDEVILCFGRRYQGAIFGQTGPLVKVKETVGAIALILVVND